MKTIEILKERYEEKNLWFAVVTDEYTEWDNGSSDLYEALEKAQASENATILVIDDCDNPVCLEEIDPEDVE